MQIFRILKPLSINWNLSELQPGQLVAVKKNNSNGMVAFGPYEKPQVYPWITSFDVFIQNVEPATRIDAKTGVLYFYERYGDQYIRYGTDPANLNLTTNDVEFFGRTFDEFTRSSEKEKEG